MGSLIAGDNLIRSCLERISDTDLETRFSPRVNLYRVFDEIAGSEELARAAHKKSRPYFADQNISRIPLQQRKVFLLLALEGFLPIEVSEILRISIDEVDAAILGAEEVILSTIATHVLIMEGEPVIAADLQLILASLGHTASIAATREEAADVVSREDFGLILSETLLADGFTGLAVVNDILKRRDIPTIFVTAYPERLLTGDRPEPTFLITKPFQEETLKAAVSQALFFQRLSHEPPKTRAASTLLDQDPLGAKFIASEHVLVIDPSGTATDAAAVEAPGVSDLHTQILQRLSSLLAVANRVDNQINWSGMGAATQRLHDLIDRPLDEIPSFITAIWAEVVELGSYLELDQKILADGSGDTNPLPPDIRRSLDSLVRVAAPWIRRFPTARQLDDESGAFLTRDDLFEPAADLINQAAKSLIIRPEDAVLLEGVIEAARRGHLQGIKARSWTQFSAKNLVLAAIGVVTTFSGGAVVNVYSEHSVLAQRVGLFLSNAGAPIERVILNLPADIRAVVAAAKEGVGAGQPPPRPSPKNNAPNPTRRTTP